jgi:hypothetical protein
MPSQMRDSLLRVRLLIPPLLRVPGHGFAVAPLARFNIASNYRIYLIFRNMISNVVGVSYLHTPPPWLSSLRSTWTLVPLLK